MALEIQKLGRDPSGYASMDEGSGLRTTRGVGHRFDPLGRAKTEEDFRSVAGHLLTGIKEDAFTVKPCVNSWPQALGIFRSFTVLASLAPLGTMRPW